MEQDRSLFRLEVDATTSSNIAEAGKWARFLAILGFSTIALFLIAMILFGARLSYTIGSMFAYGFGNLTAIIVIIFIVLAAIVGTLCYFLIRGANKTRYGIQHNDQVAFSDGIASYRNYFIMYGILAILSLLNDIKDLF